MISRGQRDAFAIPAASNTACNCAEVALLAETFVRAAAAVATGAVPVAEAEGAPAAAVWDGATIALAATVAVGGTGYAPPHASPPSSPTAPSSMVVAADAVVINRIDPTFRCACSRAALGIRAAYSRMLVGGADPSSHGTAPAPSVPVMLDRDHHLADVRLRFEVAIRRRSLLEREDTVDHRAHRPQC